MKHPRWLLLLLLLPIFYLLIPLFSNLGIYPPLKTITFENNRLGKQKLTAEFYPKSNRESVIRPVEDAPPLSGKVTVASADSAVPLPPLRAVSGKDYVVKIERQDEFTQSIFFENLPSTGFRFAYDGPQPKKIRVVDSSGSVIYEGVPSVIGADTATIAPWPDDHK